MTAHSHGAGAVILKHPELNNIFDGGERSQEFEKFRKTISFLQGLGSGSARIRMFLPCPDPHKFADPDHPGQKGKERNE